MTQRVSLAEARKQLDPPVTQEELAAKVSCDQTYISLLESGKRRPSDDLKTRLAKALGIAPSKLRFTALEPAESVSDPCDRVGRTGRKRGVA